MNEVENRIRNLNILKGKVDIVLLANMDNPCKDANFIYFAATDSDYSFFLYDFSRAEIVTNRLEFPKIKKESKIRDVKVPEKMLEYLSHKLSNKRVGVDSNLSFFLARKLKIKPVDITKELEGIRSVKSELEVKNIKKACKITSNIMEALNDFIKPGLSENKIRMHIRKMIIEAGASEAMFDVIVSSGHNTSVPHSLNADRKIKSNDIVMVDFGCRYKNYHSDMTRMFFLGSNKHRIRYEMLESLLDEVKDFIHVGMRAGDVDEFIRSRLGERFIHAAGHGLGLLPHETPVISEKSDDILKENMVFAIEPGIYFKNYGLRIEDTVLLTRKGIKTLTK